MSQSMPGTTDEQSSDYVITAVPASLACIGDWSVADSPQNGKECLGQVYYEKGREEIRVGLTIPSSKQTGGNVLACVLLLSLWQVKIC